MSEYNLKSKRQLWKDTMLLQGNGEVPFLGGFKGPSWVKYGRHLEKLVLRHKYFFPEYREGQTDFAELAKNPEGVCDKTSYDIWGCEWHTVREWDVGQITVHPLADSSKLNGYIPPDPYVDNEELSSRMEWEKFGDWLKTNMENGDISMVDGGKIFERTHFLMGMENMMIALAEEDPFVDKIIAMAIRYNLTAIDKFLKHVKPDVFHFSDDLGDQHSLLVSPAIWRKHFKPCYRAQFAACKQAGSLTSLHSDGNNSEIFEDLVEIGLDVLNCQALLIGLDKVREVLRGRICIAADIDRQTVIPFGTPADVKDYIKEMVMKLGSPKGGLMLWADIYPDVPFENIEAFLDTAAEYRNYWVGKSE